MEKDMLAVAQNDDIDIADLYTSLSPSRKKHAESVALLTEYLVRCSQEDPSHGITYSGTPEMIRSATVYHDIGMALIPNCILGKTEALTFAEQKVLRLHSVYGAKILDRYRKRAHYSPGDKMRWSLAAEIALSHHERWDGKGYPYEQMATAVLPEARAVAVAEAYDTIVRGESFCMPLPHEFALLEISDKAGTQFDPYFSALFLAHEAELKAIWSKQNTI